MKVLIIIISLLLTGCALSSDPTYQLNIYGEKNLRYGPEVKAALQKSCMSDTCKRVLFEERSIPDTSDAVVWVELKDDQSLYMDFRKDGEVVFTYGKKAVGASSHTGFLDSLEESGIALEFNGYHRWNCDPPKDSCGRIEVEFSSPLTFKNALNAIYHPKINAD